MKPGILEQAAELLKQFKDIKRAIKNLRSYNPKQTTIQIGTFAAIPLTTDALLEMFEYRAQQLRGQLHDLGVDVSGPETQI